MNRSVKFISVDNYFFIIERVEQCLFLSIVPRAQYMIIKNFDFFLSNKHKTDGYVL